MATKKNYICKSVVLILRGSRELEMVGCVMASYIGAA